MADEGGSGLEPIRVRDADPPRRRARRPAVFLDRDGVLNQVPGDGSRASSPRDETELRLVPGAPEAVRRLAGAGYLLVVVTNQPDVARGGMPFATAIALTRSVVDRLGLDDGYLCPHDGPDGCPCRKPAGGMLTTRVAGLGDRPHRVVADRRPMGRPGRGPRRGRAIGARGTAVQLGCGRWRRAALGSPCRPSW